ncbi:hypothetical protein CRUP_002936 [Coryphaenoides rupestris]|nr:hypothetical protein CRUP_002936 [Coryphaenoides rupestris]
MENLWSFQRPPASFDLEPANLNDNRQHHTFPVLPGYIRNAAVPPQECTTGDTVNMGKIIFYEERDFSGRSYEASSDCADMTSYLSRCHSCRVESGFFMVYDRSNYMGNQYFVKRGDYADYQHFMGMNDCVRSCRMIPMHRGNFRMRLYKQPGHVRADDGPERSDCPNVMDRFHMSEVNSCSVSDGHWLMYEQPDYRGRMYYLKPGDYRRFGDWGAPSGRITFYEDRNFQGRSYEASSDCADMTSYLSRCHSCRVEYDDTWLVLYNQLTTSIIMTMGKITFYEDRNFQGRSYEASSDCADMTSYLSRCHSCRVESGFFMVYDRSNYMGNQYFVKRGEYPDYQRMGMSDCIRSCRFIPMHTGQFRMRIYERENFGGQMHEMTDDCDNMTERYRMSECQSGHVMDGHWLWYEQPNYRGRMMYMRPGEYRNFRDMGMSSNWRFNSFRRITDAC